MRCRDRIKAFAPAAAVLALLAAHVCWIARDRLVPYWDEALHLRLAATYHQALRDLPRDGARPLLEVSTFYPPLHHVLVGLAFFATGLDPLAARLVNLAGLLVLGLAVAALTRRLMPSVPAAAAALIGVSLPLSLSLARHCLMDLTLSALVAVCLVLAVPREARWWRTVALGITLGAALLTKWNAPLYVAGPLAVSLFPAKGEPRDIWIRRAGHVAGGAMLALAIAAPWYLLHLDVWLPVLRYAAAQGPAEGDPHGFNVSNVVAYGWILATQVLWTPLVPLFVFALGSAAARLWRPPAAALGERRALGFLLAGLAVPYGILTIVSNKEPRALAGTIPVLAVLCAWGLERLRPSLSVLALVATTAETAGIIGLDLLTSPHSLARVHAMLPSPIAHDLAYIQPKDRGEWPAEAVVAAIDARRSEIAPYAEIAVGTNLPTINPDTLAWLALQKGFLLKSAHAGADVVAGRGHYVLVKIAGAQGPAAPGAAAPDAVIRATSGRPDIVPVADIPAPDGLLRLLQTRSSFPPPDLRPKSGVVEFGEPGARWFLGGGWGEPEGWGRWVVGRRAALRLQLDPGGPSWLDLELVAYEGLDGAQSVTFESAGERLASLDLPPSWTHWTVRVPETLQSGRIQTFTLVFARARRPIDAGASRDPRALAAGLRRLRVRRQDVSRASGEAAP